MAQKIIIDTDPGIDDAMAILLAGADKRIDLIGLTSIFGNVYTETGTRNALRLVEKMGLDIPVAEGAQAPLNMPLNEPAAFVHGDEGFGDIPVEIPNGKKDPRCAAEYLCQMAKEHKGELIICAVGPLTNLALALEHDPNIVNNVKSIVIMGGSIATPGNVSDYAEANIWNDPHAADIVFGADWPVTLVGLDVTQEVVASPERFIALGNANENGTFLNQAAQYYFKFHEETRKFTGCYMHDSTAVTAITDPDLYTFAELPLRVHCQGDAIGQTYTDCASKRRPVSCALKVDAPRVLDIFFDTLS